jgi:hypothetical protein
MRSASRGASTVAELGDETERARALGIRPEKGRAERAKAAESGSARLGSGGARVAEVRGRGIYRGTGEDHPSHHCPIHHHGDVAPLRLLPYRGRGRRQKEMGGLRLERRVRIGCGLLKFI